MVSQNRLYAVCLTEQAAFDAKVSYAAEIQVEQAEQRELMKEATNIALIFIGWAQLACRCLTRRSLHDYHAHRSEVKVD